MLDQTNLCSDIDKPSDTQRAIDQESGHILTTLLEFELEQVIGGHSNIVEIVEKVGHTLIDEFRRDPLITLGNRLHHVFVERVIELENSPIERLPWITRIALSRATIHHCSSQKNNRQAPKCHGFIWIVIHALTTNLRHSKSEEHSIFELGLRVQAILISFSKHLHTYMRQANTPLATRFRGYLPVIVDVETAGFDPQKHALLEIAAVITSMDQEGMLQVAEVYSAHITPFEGSELDPAALEFNGINPHHPLRISDDEREALLKIFQPVRAAVKKNGCTRAILVGHNPSFDLSFVNAAAQRAGLKRNPFHPFSTFDTATLGGLVYGQTVLAKAIKAAGIDWDNQEAHSARYDAEKTAELFCTIVNTWEILKRSAQTQTLEPA